MTIRLNIIDSNGEEHLLEVLPTGSLMEALRDLDYGVPAICGGLCSCATCHVYIAPEWMARLPAQLSDERELVTERRDYRPSSRLSCQVDLSPELDGLRLTLVPEE